jgi:SAM-dependent methyltransferase
MQENMNVFFSGDQLYGDSFSQKEIDQWYDDEVEAYADLGSKYQESYIYGYHALNHLHGYTKVEKGHFGEVLGFGSAYGDELLPIIKKIDNICIIDPSEEFSKTKEINGKPCKYFKPSKTGGLHFDSNKFCFATCFGVLHHIPNVSKVVQEIYRCMEDGGYVLLREPVISMGDWRYDRGPGLTKRERGIPLNIMVNILHDAGFKIEYQSMCMFPLIPLLFLINF